MIQHRVKVVLTAEQKATIVAALGALEDAIPFRLSLTSTERQRLMKLGNKSLTFVTLALEAARCNPDYIPPNIGLTELEHDEEVREVLLTCMIRLGALYDQIRDTAMAAGADLMLGATEIYRTLQASKDGALRDTVKELGERFDRPSRKRAPEESVN